MRKVPRSGPQEVRRKMEDVRRKRREVSGER
jgi:hypothetical protein